MRQVGQAALLCFQSIVWDKTSPHTRISGYSFKLYFHQQSMVHQEVKYVVFQLLCLQPKALQNTKVISLTLKNSLVEPESRVPQAISVCLARSSALSMGDTILSTVRKAARLAVYEEMMIKVKNHQTPPTMRPDRDLLEKEMTKYSLVFVIIERYFTKTHKRLCN